MLSIWATDCVGDPNFFQADAGSATVEMWYDIWAYVFAAGKGANATKNCRFMRVKKINKNKVQPFGRNTTFDLAAFFALLSALSVVIFYFPNSSGDPDNYLGSRSLQQLL